MAFELEYCPFPTLLSPNWEVSDIFETACATIGPYISANDRNIWFSEIVLGGTNLSFPEGCWQQSQVVSQDICRIAIGVSTSDMSEISLEVWLPRDWSGRFLSTANGGLSGCKCGLSYTPRVYNYDMMLTHGYQVFNTMTWTTRVACKADAFRRKSLANL